MKKILLFCLDWKSRHSLVGIVMPTLLFTMFIFTARSQPKADFSFAYSKNGCSPDTVSFTNLSTGANKYRWNFGDFSTIDTTDSPQHFYSITDVFIVRLVAYDSINGDSNEMVKTVPITQTPSGGWAYIIPDPIEPVCTKTKVRFTGPESMNPSPENVTWYFGDGDSSAFFNPYYTYNSSGNYTVKLYTTNRCGVDSAQYLYVVDSLAKPQTDFSYSSPVCPGEVVQFNNITYPYVTSCTWDFGDSSASAVINPAHIYSDTGTYAVRLIATNECASDTLSKTIKVDRTKLPTVTYSVSSNPVCKGDTVFFSCSGADINLSNWNFGDSALSVQQNNYHLYKDTGTYTVILSAGNSCGNTKTDTFIVSVKDSILSPALNFTWFSLNPCPAAIVQFIYTGNDTTSLLWRFGDGDSSISANPQHTFSDTLSYLVQLIVKSRCDGTDSITKTVNVKNNIVPFASFAYSPGNVLCLGDTLKFINFSSDYDSIWWDFGDGQKSSLTNPIHIYADTGVYPVLLGAKNKCGITSWFADRITVYNKGASPKAKINVTPLSECAGEPFNFSMTGLFVATQSWSFGDGDSSSTGLPVHIYSSPGEYTVTLISKNNCGADTSYKKVDVRQGVSAGFSLPSGCAGDTVAFTDSSSGVLSKWSWDFGDGDTSTVKNPIHVYKDSGNYDISLTVSGNGCKSAVKGNVMIPAKVLPVAAFSHKDSSLTVNFTDSSSNALTWFWQFGDGDTSALKNPVHIYLAEGTWYVCLTASNSCGSNKICDSVKVISTFIDDNSQILNDLDFFPNPAKDELTISFTLQSNTMIRLEFLNLLGEKVNSRHFNGRRGQNRIRCNTENLDGGVYFVRLYAGEAPAVNTRIVIIR